MPFRFLFSIFFLLGYLGCTKSASAQTERPSIETPKEQELQEDSEDEQHQFNTNEIEVPVPPGIVPDENKLGAIKVTRINNVPILVQRVRKDDFSPEAFRAFNLDAIEKKLKSYVFNPIALNFEEDKKIASVLDLLGVYSENPLNVWRLETVGRGKSGATHLYEGDVLRGVSEYTQDRLPLIQLLKLQELPGVVEIKRILKSDDGKLFIAMEKLSKVDLNAVEVSEKKFTEIVTFFTKFIVDLNKQGIYHSDMHCSNIMFRGDELVVIDYDSFRSGQRENLEFASCVLKSRFERYYRNKIKEFRGPVSQLLASSPKSYSESFASWFSMKKQPCIESNPSLLFFASTPLVNGLPVFYPSGCDVCSYEMSGCFTHWPYQYTYADVQWLPVVPMVYYWYQRVFEHFKTVLNYSEDGFKAIWEKVEPELRNTYRGVLSWDVFDPERPISDKQKRLFYATHLAREALGSDPSKTLQIEAFDEIAKFGSTEAALVKVVQGEMTLSGLVSALSGLQTD